MSADLLAQLERYGELLREEVAALETNARSGAATVVLRPAGVQSRRSPRRFLLPATLLVASACFGTVMLVRSHTVESFDAAQANVVAEIASRSADSDQFQRRLGDIDYEIVLSGPRPISDAERVGVSPLGFDVISSSVVVVADQPSGDTAIEFDIDPSPPFWATRCRSIGRWDAGGEWHDRGNWCWQPPRPAIDEFTSPQYSYGCQPAFATPFAAFGRRDFVAEIELPPGSPGVIFTLEDGPTVLIRPLNDYVFYRGPIVDHMEIFYPTGDPHLANTADCR